MKLLVICQHYAPEPFRLADICEHLVKKGHSVSVVTGVPNYPMGHIYDGYRGGKRREEVLNGVDVHRCFTIGRRSGAAWRFLNYYSFMMSSTAYVSRLKEEYDAVLVYQLSPVLMANAAAAYKKKHGKKLVMYCLDLWPESLTAGGISKGSAVYRYFHRVSEKLYKAADEILVTSRAFSDYFAREFGITDTQYLPQHAEGIFSRKEGRKKETVDLMFAGNVGKAQSVQTIIRAAARTKDVPALRWHIVGDGSDLQACRQLARQLGTDNVIFHGRKPVEQMPEYYSMADAMLVTLEDNATLSMTLPGKVQSYMAAGKAIIGAINGETQKVISEANCGLCCAAEDDVSLAQCACNFLDDGQRYRYGNNAIKYYQENYTIDRFITVLEEALKD